MKQATSPQRLVADKLLDVAGALDIATGIFQSVWTTVAVAGCRVLDPDRRAELLNFHVPCAVRAMAAWVPPWYALRKTDYFAVAGVFATHQDGDFVGFAPRVGEVIHWSARCPAGICSAIFLPY
jgi:hypothetical protein